MYYAQEVSSPTEDFALFAMHAAFYAKALVSRFASWRLPVEKSSHASQALKLGIDKEKRV